MTVDVLSVIVIEAEPTRVADYSANPDNIPLWYVNIQSVGWVTPPPLVRGSRLEFVARFLGRRLAYTYEIVVLDLPDQLVMRTAEGPFPMETTYTWEAAGEGRTRMTLRNRGEPAGFSRFAAPFMALAMRRANRNDLRRLKEIIEGVESRAG